MKAAIALMLLIAGGSAQAATRRWQVGDFARVRVEGAMAVHVREGPTAVSASGPQAGIDALEIEQRGDTLVVRQSRASGWAPGTIRDEPTLAVEVSARTLSGAALSGSGTLAIDRMRGDAVDLSLGGSGSIVVPRIEAGAARLAMNGTGRLGVGGHAGRVETLLIGAGDIGAEHLLADTATVRLVGSGDLKLTARKTASVVSQGSGDVTILGEANCSVTRTGAGAVHCAHGGAAIGD